MNELMTYAEFLETADQNVGRVVKMMYEMTYPNGHKEKGVKERVNWGRREWAENPRNLTIHYCWY